MLLPQQKNKYTVFAFTLYCPMTSKAIKGKRGNENLVSIASFSFNKITNFYSHSIVAGGFELISYTTLFIPLTWLMMSFEIRANNS